MNKDWLSGKFDGKNGTQMMRIGMIQKDFICVNHANPRHLRSILHALLYPFSKRLVGLERMRDRSRREGLMRK